MENQNAEEIEEDKVLLYQTQNKNVKYPDYTQSKTIKPVIEDLQKQGLISEVMWSYKIGDKIFLYGRDGVFYKINEELSTVEEKITLKEETEENLCMALALNNIAILNNSFSVYLVILTSCNDT